MIIFLLLATAVSWLRVDARPSSAGPATIPTIAHLVFGMSARNGCSDVRSMYDILRSCLFTIAACVYRAIHPNIPSSKLSFWGRLRVTVKIVVYALIAPELMIMWALRQRFGARQVAEKVNTLKRGLDWTQIHGQFAQMGGFARKDNKEVLYPKDLIFLLRCGLIDVDDLRLTEKEINDKSKGDLLSKGLVAFQTTWFIFECLTRLNQGLPLIELEVVTLAFATLNAITYGIWWYKPLNVLCPIYVHVRQKNIESSPQESDTATRNPEEEALIETGLERDESSDVQTETVVKGKARTVAVTQTAVRGAVKAKLDSVKHRVKEKGWSWLFSQAIRAIILPFVELSADDGDSLDKDRTTAHVPTFYAEGLPTEKMLLVIPLTAFIGMIFGAIHFISWHAIFPAHTQLLLWRISCVVLVVQPFFLMLGDFVYAINKYTTAMNWLDPHMKKTLADVGGTAFGFGIILYVLARFCVIVLAFLNLRDIPQGAFTVISWTSYIPHF